MVWTALSWIYVAYGNWLNNTLNIRKPVIVSVLVVYALVFSIAHWHVRFVVVFHYHFAFMSTLVIGYIYCSYRVLKHVSTLPLKRSEPKHTETTEEIENGFNSDSKQSSRLNYRSSKKTDADSNDSIVHQAISTQPSTEAPELPGEFFFTVNDYLMQAPVDTEEKRSIEYVLVIAKLYAHSGMLGLALWLADLELCHYIEPGVASYYGTNNWVLPVNPQAHAWWHFFVAMHYFCGTTVTLFMGARELGQRPVLRWRFWGLLPLVTVKREKQIH